MRYFYLVWVVDGIGEVRVRRRKIVVMLLGERFWLCVYVKCFLWIFRIKEGEYIYRVGYFRIRGRGES